MSNPFFIDENITIYTGEEAAKKLSQENDQKFYRDGEGVTAVSEERWKKAQACEKNHWFIRGAKTADDRNFHHSQSFDNYKAIKHLTFNEVLEIGCGPFTNARIISRACTFRQITLLDPMVYDYLNHPFCSYNKNYLHAEYIPFFGKVVRKLMPRAFKTYLSLFSKKTKIAGLLNMPGEQLPTTKKYDLVIMVNVIEHCYSIDTLFNNILSVTQPGSYLVFEDKLFEKNHIVQAVANTYDAAHPIKVDKDYLFKFLNEHFSTAYERVQPEKDYYADQDQSNSIEDLYYIGKRK